jgi:hypothetical protein
MTYIITPMPDMRLARPHSCRGMAMHFLIRSFLIWLLFIPLAVLNGVFRDLLLTPSLGDTLGRAISSLTLSFLIFGLTVLFVKKLGVSTLPGLFIVGGFWLVLTVLFEFIFFIIIMAHPLDVLFEDYNLFRGRLWFLVLVTTFFSPFLAFRIRVGR